MMPNEKTLEDTIIEVGLLLNEKFCLMKANGHTVIEINECRKYYHIMINDVIDRAYHGGAAVPFFRDPFNIKSKYEVKPPKDGGLKNFKSGD